MRAGVTTLCLLFLPAATLSPSAAAQEGPQIIDSRTLSQVSLEELGEDLQNARFVFLGEHHDIRQHHAIQLRVLRLLRERGVDTALAFEMFAHEDGPALERWTEGEMGGLELYDLFAARWNPRLWSLYSDIFHYARQNRIPMAGINVPIESVRKVVEGGFASLERAEKLGITEVECDAGSKYLILMKKAMNTGAGRKLTLQRFCETQVFWDTSMAVNLLKVDKERPGRVWVVVAGIFHAWKHGIPAQLAKRSEAPLRVVLPSGEASYLRYDVLQSDADYVWWVASPGNAP